MHRETVLRATLEGWRRSAFAWGSADCLMSVMTYARALLAERHDPGAPWRGRYHDAAGADALLDAAGGPIALLGLALEPHGFARVQHPGRGDMLVADVLGTAVGGLCLGDYAAFLLLRGCVELRMDRVKVLAAWR